jgi:hypothetical protein
MPAGIGQPRLNLAVDAFGRGNLAREVEPSGMPKMPPSTLLCDSGGAPRESGGIQTKGFIARCVGNEAVQCKSKRLLAEGLSAFQLLKLAEQLIALSQKFVPLAKSNIALP